MSSPNSTPEVVRGRRGARRLLVQALYQWLSAGGEPQSLVAEFLEDRAPPGIDTAYFHELLLPCLTQVERFEALIASVLDRPLAEVDPVERAVLLLATAEFELRREIAMPVIIDEAVELARLYGSAEGHRYVNGVLDRLAVRLRPQEKNRPRDGNCG